MPNLYISRRNKSGNMMAKVLQIDREKGRVRVYIPAFHGADPTLDDPEFAVDNDNKDSNEETTEDTAKNTQTTNSESETPEDPEISTQDNEEQPAQPDNNSDVEDPNKPPEEDNEDSYEDGEEESDEKDEKEAQDEKDNIKYKNYPWAETCCINFMDEALEPTFGRMFALCGEESEEEVPVLLPNKGDIGWIMFEGGDIGRPIFIGNWCHQMSMLGETWIKDMRAKYASWVASLQSSAGSGAGGSGGAWNGEYYEGLPTYQLSESAIKDIATCITGETGGSDDVACRQEASQMANLNEVTYGKSNTESDIISTIHGGWYAKSSWTRGCTETAIQAVKSVLIEGKRVFPRYVTEHDTFPMDIVNAKDRSAYSKGDPVSNRHGSNYKFYCFMGSSQDGDIAGYFQKDYEKYKTDDNAKVAGVSAGGGTVGSGGSEQARKAVEAALSKIGCPYVWGGTGPNGFDCSGLCQWAYKQVGVSISRTTDTQKNDGISVSLDNLAPGDLVICNGGQHVVMVVDGATGEYVHAPGTGKTITKGDYYTRGSGKSSVIACRRICP